MSFIQSFRVICSTKGLQTTLNSVVFHTIEGSDAHVFARQCSILVPAFVYGLIWLLASIAIVALAIYSALIVYK